MSQSIRVLIGDDTLELGISWATAFKEAGMYAITRPVISGAAAPTTTPINLKTLSQ